MIEKRGNLKDKSNKRSAIKKAEQLEMPYGTARNRLIKQTMFRFAQELGYDTCFQCGEKIENHTELSMEHKTPWLDSVNPVELFFDQGNISFSHLSCNSGASRNTVSVHVKEQLGKSGFKGVQINDSKKHKYRVKVRIDGKDVIIAYGNDPRKLAEIYDNKAIEIHGKDAITNKKMGLI